jgi:C1A family cysteine protease
MRRQGEKRAATPSRLFIYYNERDMEGTIGEDAGAEIRDGIKSVNHLGAPAERYWPYAIGKFTRRPTKAAYTRALARQALTYERIDNHRLGDIKRCLAGGHPFVFGFAVYDYFESADMERDGVLRMPEPGEDMLGGHAVLAVGYDDGREAVLVRNSWGPDWVPSMRGHFWMPYSYITTTDLCDDFWTITLVE